MMPPTSTISPVAISGSPVGAAPIQPELQAPLASSQELVVLDEALKPLVQVRGRLGTVRVASNELCLTLDQIQTLAAEDDHA